MRNYAAAVEAKAREWRAHPIERVQVRRQGYFTPSNDGACPVILPCGLESFLKPRDHNNLTVAREKIASDLGYDLGLPVAPTVVREACDEFRHHCVLSLVSLPQPRPWHTGSDELRRLGVHALESLRAFWIWIGETDHEGNYSNLLYERHGDSLKVVSIDHARSLGFGCQGNVFAHASSIGYGTARLDGAEMARNALVSRVEEFPEERLSEVVGRLRPILTQVEEGEILDMLRRRRDMLRAWLDAEGDHDEG